MADSKISDLAAITSLADTDELVVASSGASKKITGANLKASMPGLGSSELIYRYTVSGSDKASIDTGVDTPDAGSNDWTNGDLLEVFLYARTDEAVDAVSSVIDLLFNNDSGANYDRQFVAGGNTTAFAGKAGGGTSLQVAIAGSTAGANVFGVVQIVIPNYAGTVAYKTGRMDALNTDTTATGMQMIVEAIQYRSTSAIARLAFSLDTAGKKFKVGTQLLIYKRLAS